MSHRDFSGVVGADRDWLVAGKLRTGLTTFSLGGALLRVGVAAGFVKLSVGVGLNRGEWEMSKKHKKRI